MCSLLPHRENTNTPSAPPHRTRPQRAPPPTASVRYGRIHDRNRHATSTVTIYQASSYGRKLPPRDPNGHDICCSITRGNGRRNSPRGPTDHDIRQKQDIQRLSEETLLLTDILLSRQIRTSTIKRLQRERLSASSTSPPVPLTQSSASPTLYFILIMQTPGICALILFLRRSRKVRFSFGKTVTLSPVSVRFLSAKQS